MRKLTADELEVVNGGLDIQEGGLAIMTIGLGALMAPVALAGIGAFAVSMGVTMLVGGAIGEACYGS